MKRKQYEGRRPMQPLTYFTNFLDTVDDSQLKTELKRYNATLGKSKKNYAYNVKWHDEKFYTLFVLRWS
jgi:hypothetical protein